MRNKIIYRLWLLPAAVIFVSTSASALSPSMKRRIQHFSQSAFYVSTTGNDSNPGTFQRPFLTLEAARTVMEASQTRITYIRSGTYARSAPLILTSADDGETWASDPCDPAQSAILDGGNSITDIFIIRGGSNITIAGVKMQNIQYRGVGIHGGAALSGVGTMNFTTGAASGNTVINTEVANIGAPIGSDFEYESAGGVVAEGNVTNTNIINNYFHDSNGMGARIDAFSGAGDNISSSRIANNVILKTNQTISDGGAIYVQDLNANSTNITVSNNFVRDYQGTSNNLGHCIYLDAAASNVSVTGNICGPPGPGQIGQSAIIGLCGKNNTITGNIIDLGGGAQDNTYEIGTCGAPAIITDMTGNIFRGNIIISGYSGSGNTTFAGQNGYSYPSGGPPPHYPVIANNIYHNYGGGTETITGNGVSDSNPVHSDPQLSGWTYTVAGGSPASSGPVSFFRIVGGWGPPGFTIPQIGTAPSSPH